MQILSQIKNTLFPNRVKFFIVSMVFSTLLLAACLPNDNANNNDIPTPQTEQVTEKEVKIKGNLVFKDRKSLDFGITGKIGEIHIKEGQHVQQDQLLMTIDNTTKATFHKQIQQSRLNLDNAIETQNLHMSAQDNLIAKKESEIADTQKTQAISVTSLDTAHKKLANFEDSQVQKITSAEQAVTTAELKLETAERNLNNHAITNAQEIVTAQKTKETAIHNLQIAEDALHDYRLGWLRKAPFRDGIFDFDEVNRYETAIEIASIAIDKAEADLDNILDDTKELDKADLNIKVTVAQNTLTNANTSLNNLTDGSSSLTYKELQTAITSATKEIEESKSTLVKLSKELEELISDPNDSQNNLNASSVALYKQALVDAVTNYEKSEILSPSEGLIYSINGKIDDRINNDSIVLKLVDPNSLIFQGYVEGDYLQHINLGTAVKVHIPELSVIPYKGEIVQISAVPKTTRGIITFPLEIAIEMPKTISSNMENFQAYVKVLINS
jgi:multidrug resistance efflux pump|tara:strand:- start:3254 stop:4750 length:1497 start_codon:yes stop_codon:yes gene_type:complete